MITSAPDPDLTPLEKKVRRVIAALKSLGITREPQSPELVCALKQRLYSEVDHALGRLRVEERLFTLDQLSTSRKDDDPRQPDPDTEP